MVRVTGSTVKNLLVCFQRTMFRNIDTSKNKTTLPKSLNLSKQKKNVVFFKYDYLQPIVRMKQRAISKVVLLQLYPSFYLKQSTH